MCLVLIFLNTIVEKHTLNAEVTLSYQFHVQNGLFKVPKIYNINFWIRNDPNSGSLKTQKKTLRNTDSGSQKIQKKR